MKGFDPFLPSFVFLLFSICIRKWFMVLSCLRVVISQSSRYCLGRGWFSADQIHTGYASSGCKIGSLPSLSMLMFVKGSPILTCLIGMNHAATPSRMEYYLWIWEEGCHLELTHHQWSGFFFAVFLVVSSKDRTPALTARREYALKFIIFQCILEIKISTR